jgi:hypothetical protein
LKRVTVTIIIVAVVFIAIMGYLFVFQLSPANNTTNNTNIILNSSNITNTTGNNSNVSKTSQDQTDNNNPPPPPPEISADEAKDLAKKYVGPGVILGKPVKTTYKRIHVWQVPVYTMNHKFINNIYIDARTGKKVN